ncbi:MAG TPA: hypothetical protein VGF25_22100 [Thermoleophilaceae bacterium]|jgi:hypothetical protein
MFRIATTQKLEHPAVIVRHSASGDASELARLAALDSARPLRGPALVAESDARLLAALPIGSGRPIADPFEPTAELVALLELRRDQLTARDGDPRRGIGERVRSLLRLPLTPRSS